MITVNKGFTSLIDCNVHPADKLRIKCLKNLDFFDFDLIISNLSIMRIISSSVLVMIITRSLRKIYFMMTFAKITLDSMRTVTSSDARVRAISMFSLTIMKGSMLLLMSRLMVLRM